MTTTGLLGLSALASLAIVITLYGLHLLASNRQLRVGLSVGVVGTALWAAAVSYAYIELFDSPWAVPESDARKSATDSETPQLGGRFQHWGVSEAEHLSGDTEAQ